MARTSCAKKSQTYQQKIFICVELPIKAKELATKFVQANHYERARIAGKRKLMHSEMV